MRSISYNLVDFVLPFERREANLELDARVFVAPWMSLIAENKLDNLEVPAECTTTIVKWEWENADIEDVIRRSNVRKIFCTSTGPRIPFANYLYPDFVKPEVATHVIPHKDILASFVGWKNNGLRSRLESYSDKFRIVFRESFSSYTPRRNAEEEQSFVNIMARSRFSLCPKGLGSGTRRFWESLALGSIPILISDSLRLPKCWDWKNTVVIVSEKEALWCKNRLIHATNINNEEEMRANCLKAHAFFSNDSCLQEYIHEQL